MEWILAGLIGLSIITGLFEEEKKDNDYYSKPVQEQTTQPKQEEVTSQKQESYLSQNQETQIPFLQEQELSVKKNYYSQEEFESKLQQLISLTKEADSLYNSFDFNGAKEKYEKAVSLNRELLNSNYGSISEIRKLLNKGLSDNLVYLGVVYENLGDYQKSISYYEESLKISKELDDKKGISDNLTNLGIVYRDLGDYQKSISYYEESLKIEKELDDKKGISNNLTNLGNVYENLGDYQKSISYYEESLKIKKELDDKKGISGNLMNLGVVHRDLGDYQKSISYYEESLKIKKELDDKKGIVRTWLNLADIYLETDRIDEAKKIYKLYNNPFCLGRFYLKIKDYEKAIVNFNKSLKDALKNRNANFMFASYLGLAHSYYELAKLEESYKNYQKAVELCEEQREKLSEGERQNFFSAKVLGFGRSEAYEGLIKTLIKQQKYKTAFYYSEFLKGRVLSEAIAKGFKIDTSKIPKDVLDRENEFKIKIRRLEREMEVLYKNNAMDIYNSKEKELKQTKDEQSRFIVELRKNYPEYASINYPKPVGVQFLNLNPDEILIEYEVTDDKLYIFMINGEDKGIWVGSKNITREELTKIITEYRNYFEGIDKFSDLAKYDIKTSNKLYQILFGNTLKKVANNKTLIIIPDEITGLVPFESLIETLPQREQIGEGKYGPFPIGVKYLGDRFNVLYSQSATSLNLARTLKKDTVRTKNVFAVLDPIYSPKDSDIKGGVIAKVDDDSIELMGKILRWQKMGLKGITGRGEGSSTQEEVVFPRLNKTAVIENYLKSGRFKGTILKRSRATEEEIVNTDFSPYRYVIFGTHGILDGDIPYINQPALVLNQINKTKEYDGFLTMNEVMGLRIPAEAVMLIACKTAVGENIKGEGVMGMGRAFQFAGASNILMSLWSVEEKASVNLAEKFLDKAKTTTDLSKALRLAREEIRREGYEHPFFWSAFILMGK